MYFPGSSGAINLDGFGKEEDKSQHYLIGEKYAQLKPKS